jgi:hypothetical protein
MKRRLVESDNPAYRLLYEVEFSRPRIKFKLACIAG